MSDAVGQPGVAEHNNSNGVQETVTLVLRSSGTGPEDQAALGLIASELRRLVAAAAEEGVRVGVHHPPAGPDALSPQTRPIDPLIREARDQYLADFADLMAHRATNPDERWVAYHGRDRIGLGASKAALIKVCLDRGLRPGEFLVLGIDPAVADPNL